MKLSVIIITKNEEKDIEACIQSVRFANEIIVLDSGSTDKTVEICRQYTPHVYETDWPGYGVQKNRALAKARMPWVLSIDADERVTEALAHEIQAKLAKNTDCDAFTMPRVSYFLGKKIRFGTWAGEQHLALFKREKAQFSEVVVHEKVTAKASVLKIGQLKKPLEHRTYASLEELLEKTNQYSTLGAKKRFDLCKRGGIMIAIGRSLFAFLRGYVFKLGFLDGREGFLVAVSIAEECFWRYVKLGLLSHNKNIGGK